MNKKLVYVQGIPVTITQHGQSTLPPELQAQCDEITQETFDLMTEAVNRMLRKKKPGRPHTKGNPMPYSQRQLNRIRR